MVRACLCLAVLLATACGYERIDVGNVGLLVSTVGAQRGLQETPVVSGWVSYNPFTEDVIEFPSVNALEDRSARRARRLAVIVEPEAIAGAPGEAVMIGVGVFVAQTVDQSGQAGLVVKRTNGGDES